MPRFYVDTGGSASNSGSSDNNAADLSGSTASLVTSTFTLDGSPDLSGLITAVGLTQSTIYIANATNANRKIFPITAFDDTLNTVTVSGSPTVSGSGAWAIGGRMLMSGMTGNENNLQPGDEMIINNSPAASTVSYLTMRTAGTITGGFVKIKGKVGVRPVLNVTNTSNAIDCNTIGMIWFENLEIDQDGASGNGFNNTGSGTVIYNVKISDCGNDGIDVNNDGIKIIGCDISGCGGDAIDMGTFVFAQVVGNYIHDLTGSGFNSAATVVRSVIVDNVFSQCAGSQISLTGAPSAQSSNLFVYGNTFYKGSIHGLTVSDGDHNITLMNNLFLDNGNTGSEYNLNWPTVFELSNFGDYNCFNQGGGFGGSNLNNYTQQAHDLVSAPDISTSTFLPSSASPLKGAGFPGPVPMTNAVLTGYRDIGAMQRQEAGGGDVIISGSRGLAQF